MITTTKASIESIINNMDTSLKTYSSNLSNKSASELYKAEDNKSKSTSDGFQKLLNSKTDYKNEKDTSRVTDNTKNDTLTNAAQTNTAAAKDVKDTSNTEETKDVNSLDDLKEKLQELEEESKSDPKDKDKVQDILSELLALLSKYGIKEEDLKVDGKINTDMLKNIMDGINTNKSSNNNLSNIMDKIMELLKNDSVKDKLDTDSLKNIQNLLSNLSSKLGDDNTETGKNIKGSIKNLMSEVSDMLNNKQNQSGKVLTLEDMLNKNYSQGNKDDSSWQDQNTSSNNTSSSENKVDSKEDKFLNSLISDDKDDSSNKINLFAARNSVIQNQNVNSAARGLTINKATMTEDLIKDVKFMSNNGLKELTVKVNPGNLGEITIKLIQEDGVLKANLKANSKETTALLSQNLVEIKKQLGEQNIKVSDVNIELYQDDTTFFKDQGFGGQLSEEQGRQNSNSESKVSNVESISNESLDENLAQENSKLNYFA